MVLDDLVFQNTHAGLFHRQFSQGDAGIGGGQGSAAKNEVHLLLREGGKFLLSGFHAFHKCVQVFLGCHWAPGLLICG